MTPEERRELVERPFPVIRRIAPCGGIAGTSIAAWSNGYGAVQNQYPFYRSQRGRHVPARWTDGGNGDRS